MIYSFNNCKKRYVKKLDDGYDGNWTIVILWYCIAGMEPPTHWAIEDDIGKIVLKFRIFSEFFIELHILVFPNSFPFKINITT